MGFKQICIIVTSRRFQLHDDYMQGNLESHVTQRWNPSEINSFDNSQSGEKLDTIHCSTCFGNDMMILDLENIDFTKEWLLCIPLMTQILLESFINKSSLHRTPDVQYYVEKKLGQLQDAVDSLFKVYNIKHRGVLQERQKQKKYDLRLHDKADAGNILRALWLQEHCK